MKCNAIAKYRGRVMPYIAKGKTVYKKVDGLKKVGTAKSRKTLKSYKRLLNALEHGWKPTRKRK